MQQMVPFRLSLLIHVHTLILSHTPLNSRKSTHLRCSADVNIVLLAVIYAVRAETQAVTPGAPRQDVQNPRHTSSTYRGDFEEYHSVSEAKLHRLRYRDSRS